MASQDRVAMDCQGDAPAGPRERTIQCDGPRSSYENAPRAFRAVAMPSGDRDFGVPGPLVAVREHVKGSGRGGRVSSSEAVDQKGRRTVQVRELLYSLEEAIALRDELNGAIRAIDLARELAVDVAAEVAARAAPQNAVRPRAYQGPWPIRAGGTLAEVGFEEVTPPRPPAVRALPLSKGSFS